MGTQQLLFIVLGLVLIGVAIFIGISIFKTNAVENNRQECINRIQLISDMALSYLRKPVEQGGGGGSFENFAIDEDLTTKDEVFKKIKVVVKTNKNRIIVTARGREIGLDGFRPIIMKGTILPSGLKITKTN